MSVPQSQIIESIKSGNSQVYEEIFNQYYPPLVNLATGILKDKTLAEEQVQEVFIKLWERRSQLDVDMKLLPYLMVSVRNRCYNQSRNDAVADKYVSSQLQQYRDQIFNEEYSEFEESTIDRLYQVIDQLPDKCKEVFKLSRFEHMSHREIAEKLSISTKTIENHITKAMKILKAEMLVLIIYFLSRVGDL
ncbi:RNA polymerase sigma-70 factor [Reichenbachiella versicolor]|uniref:RNA polymerase sigma-70 factor n=1 Tax=Reichenbachiella versicolor TaxID=1821036 RepID=UPI000D6DCE35|nr:RNA polymerase sigma-70 factor [Reichenbachiella versicolor]